VRVSIVSIVLKECIRFHLGRLSRADWSETRAHFHFSSQIKECLFPSQISGIMLRDLKSLRSLLQ
jgi:hypothetical protein